MWDETTGDCGSGRVESNGRFELPAVQVMSQCFTENAIPPPERVQLLRTLPQSGHEAGDTQISPACQMLLAVRAADGQRHLACMVGSPRQGGEQERPAGYRLTMMLRIGEAHEQAPPVVDQRYTARQQPAAFEIMRGEAAPAPLVLQLVKRILAVGPIAIQLTERQDLAVERGHQRGVFPDLPIRPDLGKAEPRLRIEQACAQAGLSLRRFPWSDAAGKTGIARNAFYLVRPDGYVGLAAVS